MKKVTLLSAFILIAVLLLAGCGSDTPAQVSYEDGTYRGVFLDGGEMQVNVQFALENNIVTSARYRHLAYRGTDYLSSDDEIIVALKEQYEQAIEYLVGKDIRDSLADLYQTDFVDDIDTLSGATIRGNKVISSIRDALNRGVYSY